MSGGFGFQNYATAKKTPSSQAVGQALLQRGQGAGQMAPTEMPVGPGQMAPPMAPAMQPGQMAAPDDAALRMQGAEKMTGAGQMDDNASEDDGAHSPNAVNVSVGEALTRMGGGYTTNPNPFKDREKAKRLVQQHGLSAIEADLLARTGGL